MVGAREATKAAFYQQLRALLGAGLPIVGALETLAKRGGAGAGLAPAVSELRAGASLVDALRGAKHLDELELQILAAGEVSGTLEEACGSLATFWEERAKFKRSLASALAYPLVVVHCAILLPSLAILVAQGIPAYLWATLPVLLGAYGVVAAFFVARRLIRGTPLAPVVDGFFLHVPLVNRIVRARAIGGALRCFAALYHAGIPALQALESASAVAGNQAVAAAFDAIRRRAEGGTSLPEAFAASRDLPLEVTQLAATGATTGRLDDLLVAGARLLEDDGQMAQKILVTVISTGAILIAGLIVAMQVIAFYTARFSGLL